MDILIEPSKLCGRVRAISSKSDVHRALIAAALAKGCSRIHFTTLSEDIAATVGSLQMMGASVVLGGTDGDYTATVNGFCKMPSDKVTIYAHECGTTARLLLPVAAALLDSFVLKGSGGLCKRPFEELCSALKEHGTVCDSTYLPIFAKGRLKSGVFKIRGDISSQYISGLLFALPLLEGDSEIQLTTPAVSAGYIDMTLDTLAKFNIKVEKTATGYKVRGGQSYRAIANYTAEGDWSNSTFWLCAGAMGEKLTVWGLNEGSLQKDKTVIDILRMAGAKITFEGGAAIVNGCGLFGTELCGEDIPDALPALATALCLAKGKSVISGGARLKIKESDRLYTTAEMLKALGADIIATDDGFEIEGIPSFSGGEVNAANDHRIAMCAAIAAQCATAPVIIRGADCVNKSYPTFFEDFKRLGGKCSVING